MKHGIFAGVVVLTAESRAEFDRLLEGLRTDFHPEGMLENTLAEKRTTLQWRYRRLLTAEGALIETEKWADLSLIERGNAEIEDFIASAMSSESSESSDSSTPSDSSAPSEHSAPSEPSVGGLMARSTNPSSRKLAVDLLKALCARIETEGFVPSLDIDLLRMVFGKSELILRFYRLSSSPYVFVNGVGPTEPDFSAEGRKANYSIWLRTYIAGLEVVFELPTAVNELRQIFDGRSSGVPKTPRFDRLLRYEASLERSVDRTLSQLERVQRMRLLQNVPPEQHVRMTLE